jgi:NAD(P)H-hydrate epimerase
MATLDPLRPRTRAEMRELDRRAIEEFRIPSLILMENAGRAAADVACEMSSPRQGCVIVFCGKGNNGGDGFVLARHLANRGYDVRCHYAGALSEVPAGGDPGVNLAILRRMGVTVYEHGDVRHRDDMARAVGWAALLVDGLLGTGLAGPVREPYSTLISFLNYRRAPILALDIPSGLDCDTGEVLGRAVHATRTVTFGAPKVGFTRGQGPELCGRVTVADISIPRALLAALPPGAAASGGDDEEEAEG